MSFILFALVQMFVCFLLSVYPREEKTHCVISNEFLYMMKVFITLPLHNHTIDFRTEYMESTVTEPHEEKGGWYRAMERKRKGSGIKMWSCCQIFRQLLSKASTLHRQSGPEVVTEY